MQESPAARRFAFPVRPLVAILVTVCAWTAVSVPSHGQQSAQTSLITVFPGSAWQAVAHGKAAEAEALARARPAGDPMAAAVLGHLAIVQGRYAEAIAALEPAATRAPTSDAALELGLLQQRLGRTAAATTLLTTIFRQAAGVSDVAGLVRAGRAARALNRPQDANALFRAAARTSGDPTIQMAWGELFLEKHTPAEAVKSFQLVLTADPRWAPAHAGLGRALAEDDPPAAAAAAARAIEIDPTLADAHLLLAELDLDNTRYDAARERIGRVLATNPSHLGALALSAAIAYLREGRAAFDVEAKRSLAINPAFGAVYRAAGELAARHYRFDEAVALTREAIALDPTDPRSYAALGMSLMRTGDEAGARPALERSFRDDGFDRVVLNLLRLLDKLDTFVVVQEGDITLKLAPEEAAVMREYAMPLAQEALRTLSAKYSFTPRGPILVEIFPVHDDFAVRTLGLPGMLGALGACFGRVVTLDSPRAREPGSFSWQATLWHEMAHVITLQMSNQRIPRWLTEGISEYEERRARSEWGREMEAPFAMALEGGKTLKLKDLNSGFTRPDTIGIAYYQASLLVEHIVATYGEAKLQALVRAYGEGLEGDAAVEKVLGAPLEQMQAAFDTSMDRRFGALRAALREVPGSLLAEAGRGRGSAPPDLTLLRAAASANPGSFQAQMALGRALAEAGDRAAFAPLEKAAALVPVSSGADNPHGVMAALAEKLGDHARAIQEYQALLSQDHTAVDPARRLAALAEKSPTREGLAMAYQRVVAIDPFDAQAHSGLGRIALRTSDAATAVREFRVALAIGPPDKASAHCDLGEAYLLAGQLPEAKKQALAALEIAPSFERAQELLLRSIKAVAPAGVAR